MEQKMIMHYSISHFEESIEKWCEAGWRVVPGSQGMWQEDRSTTDHSPREKYWVWIQEPIVFESEDISLDIGL